MRREILYSFSLWLLVMCGWVFANGYAEISMTTSPMLDEQLNLHVELDLLNYSSFPVQGVMMYYRDFDESTFESQRLNSEGMRYLASVDLSAYEGSVVEYFFDVEYADGSHQAYPPSAPEMEMMSVSLQNSADDSDGIVIISPEPNESIYTDEFLLTVSFFPYSSRIDKARTKLFLNEWDVSRFVKVFDEFLTFAPKRVPPGKHKIILELYGSSGRLISRKSWSFDALQRKGPSRVSDSNVNIDGDFYAESRTENLVDGAFSNHYARTGLRLNLTSGAFSAGTKLFVSNQETSTLQPINRYTGWAQTTFWNGRYLRLTGGDTYPRMNPFILNNVFLRGFHGAAFLKFLNFDYARGKTRRAIEGSERILPDSTTSILPGTYQRDVWAARASFGARDVFQWGFMAAKGKDNAGSIQFGQDGEESANFGTDIYVASFNKRFVFEGSYNLSLYNPNIQDGMSVSREELEQLGVSIDQGIYDVATDVITVNQYLVVLPARAYQGQLRLNYFNNRISVLYKYVQDQYHSLGQPFLLRDNKGITITDNIRLFRNQVFLNLRYQDYENNLSAVKAATTENNTLSFNMSYFPLNNLPTLTLGYNNHRRNNGLQEPLSSSTLFVEDNQTNTINFSSSYSFLLSNLKNRLTLNILNYNRTDNSSAGLGNLSNTFSFILQTLYNVPLKSHLEFTFQQTENSANNAGTSAVVSDLSVSSFGAGLEYKLSKLFNKLDRLTLGANGRIGLIDNSTPLTGTQFDYNRSFLNGRLIYNHSAAGRISFNADLANYSGDRDFRDYIITARYDVRF